MAAQNKWLRLFQDFVADIRIVSKEVVSDDPRGTPLVLWESQRRFIKNVGEGLDDGIHIFNCLKVTSARSYYNLLGAGRRVLAGDARQHDWSPCCG